LLDNPCTTWTTTPIPLQNFCSWILPFVFLLRLPRETWSKVNGLDQKAMKFLFAFPAINYLHTHMSK
jgi:hypothetical protein